MRQPVLWTAKLRPWCQSTTWKPDLGRIVALVEESGSSKSIAISLLERFYDPHSGLILLDNIVLRLRHRAVSMHAREARSKAAAPGSALLRHIAVSIRSAASPALLRVLSFSWGGKRSNLGLS